MQKDQNAADTIHHRRRYFHLPSQHPSRSMQMQMLQWRMIWMLTLISDHHHLSAFYLACGCVHPMFLNTNEIQHSISNDRQAMLVVRHGASGR
jgi:hypothetical protein